MNYTIEFAVPLTQDEAENLPSSRGDSWSYGCGDAGFIFQGEPGEWEDYNPEIRVDFTESLIAENMYLTLLL